MSSKFESSKTRALKKEDTPTNCRIHTREHNEPQDSQNVISLILRQGFHIGKSIVASHHKLRRGCKTTLPPRTASLWRGPRALRRNSMEISTNCRAVLRNDRSSKGLQEKVAKEVKKSVLISFVPTKITDSLQRAKSSHFQIAIPHRFKYINRKHI